MLLYHLVIINLSKKQSLVSMAINKGAVLSTDEMKPRNFEINWSPTPCPCFRYHHQVILLNTYW